MSQTTNFGFPLWGDIPPEGATGKDLRDAILGEGEDSFASMVDRELGDINNLIRTYYYTRSQVDEKLMRINLNSQSDMSVNDDAHESYVKNRTHYDSRSTLTYYVPQTEDDNAIDYKNFKWTKLSSKPIFTTDLTATSLMIENDPDGLEKYISKLSDDVRISVKKNTATYNLEWNVFSVFAAAFSDLPPGHNMYAFSYSARAKVDDDGSLEQNYIDDNVTFQVWVLCVREDSKLTYNDDGTITTMGGGMYICWRDDNSGFSGAKVTIAAGTLKKLDSKYINLSNHYTKAQSDTRYYTKDEVAEQLAAILPAFSSADNGKVLSIKDGRLAWVEVQTAAPDELHVTQAYSVVESGGELWIDGDNRTVPIDGAYETIAENGELKLI